MTRVRVPAGGGDRSRQRIDSRPGIALHVHIRASLGLLQREPDVTVESGRKFVLRRLVKRINFVEGTGGDRCGLEPGRRCGGDLSHVEHGRDPDRGTEQNYPRQFTSHTEPSVFSLVIWFIWHRRVETRGHDQALWQAPSRGKERTRGRPSIYR